MSKLLNPPAWDPAAPAPPPAVYQPPPPPGAWPGPAPWYVPAPERDESIPLSHYLWILKRRRWRILAFVATVVISTLVVSSRLTPAFEAVATIDVDRRTPTGVLGQEAMQYPGSDSDQFLATQVKLIQSDSVLRPVARRFKLATEDREDGGRLATPEADDAPVKLKGLRVTRPPSTYLLLVAYRSPDPRLAADVANAIAASYIEHTYSIRYRSSASLSSFMEGQLEELKAKMERSSAALAQFERELSVINPEEKTNILSSRLLQLNAEYTNAQADRLKKEAAYRSVQGGSTEAAQVSTQGEALRKLAERVGEAGEAFAQVKLHYGVNHPEYRKSAAQLEQLQQAFEAMRRSIASRVEIEYREAQNRENMLDNAVAQAKAEYDRINARSFEYQALKRGAEADKKLYEELVRKIKEAGINAGFQNSAIRLADPARPPLKPVFPNLALNLLAALLLSSALAAGAAVVSDVLDKTVRDPEQVRRALNAEVLGSLPMVKQWRGKLPRTLEGEKALVPASRAVGKPVCGFSEAVRTLRNSILLGKFDRDLRSLMVTSAAPGEGKSTVAVHLALAHAQQNRKTLLVDCDLRRPSVARLLGLPREPGLAGALSNGMNWRDHLVQIDGVPDLDVLPTAHGPRREADLVGRFLPQILAEAGDAYDLIVVDAPPLLGFPEPLQMAVAVDGVVVITLAGQTARDAVATVLGTLKRLRVYTVGLVLNEVSSDLSDNYRYYNYYGKYYQAKKD